MNQPRLVIADDSELMRTLLGGILAVDYEIVANVENGRAAVEAVQQWQPDLVLLDVAMPILNGFEAAREIRLICPSTQIIFVSEHREQSYVQTAFATGASGYVLKSKMASELLPAIQQVLSGGEYGLSLQAS